MASIPASLHVIGELHSEEDLLIEGRVEGDIHVLNAVLTIADQAQIDADIRGRQVHIRGTVRGTISASEQIEIGVSASVTGNVSANQVVILEGAQFNGRIDMNRRTIAALVARYRAEGDRPG
ncbi:MAG: bactofilin family protein [Vicinamibacterales bacterium]